MIGKTIVAVALLLAFPAQADDSCTMEIFQIIRSAPAPYVRCVAQELDQLSEKDGPKAGDSLQDISHRWERAISAKCTDQLMEPIPKMRAVCNDTVRPPVYLDVLTMTMRQVISFRASDDYWRWRANRKIEEISERKKKK